MKFKFYYVSAYSYIKHLKINKKANKLQTLTALKLKTKDFYYVYKTNKIVVYIRSFVVFYYLF